MATSVFGFFGLRENPFSINPNPHFLYLTPLAQASSHRLVEGIRDRKGLILLTGEVGTGKTLLLRRLLDWLAEQKMPTALIFNSHVNSDHLLDFILSDFGVRCESSLKSEKLIALNQWLLERFRAGQTPALIIDEAQGLPLHALEEVRLLLNLETPRQKLLQVVLAGQPELEEKLRRHELRQLRQRITVRCRTAPLTAAETEGYIRSRLRTAGAQNPIFEPEAAAAVHAYAKGIPRVINLLCEHSLINACADGSRTVSPLFVERAAHDCQLDQIESVKRALHSSPMNDGTTDEISSIFAGMSLSECVSSPALESEPRVDSALLAESVLAALDSAALRPMDDSPADSPQDNSADPFSLTAELPPSTDLAAFGEYPSVQTPSYTPADHSPYDRANSFGNGHRAPSSASSSSPQTRARAGTAVSPATSSLFRAWLTSFLADARSTHRQLQAIFYKQLLKLRPFLRNMEISLRSISNCAARIASDPRIEASCASLSSLTESAWCKVTTQLQLQFQKLSNKTKSLAQSPPTGRQNFRESSLDRRSKAAGLRHWLREPFALRKRARNPRRRLSS